MATTLYDVRVCPGEGTKWTHCLCVHPIRADLAGHLDPITSELIRPDDAALREALPHYWRKAFDRTRGRFWFPDTGDANRLASLTLRDTRGRTIASLYAQPYVYPSTAR